METLTQLPYNTTVKIMLGSLRLNLLPDAVIRRFTRLLLATRLPSGYKSTSEIQLSDLLQFVHSLEEMPIAIKADDAKSQHYELPTSFFKLVLGNNLKYRIRHHELMMNRIKESWHSHHDFNAYNNFKEYKGDESFFRSVLGGMERVYLNRNPTAKSVLELVQSADGGRVCYDHLAFRTFGVNGHGIDSMASIFLDFGYTQQEELRFPAKKLKALWFSPPRAPLADGGSGVNGPLPRIFISELLVDQMSAQAQEIIKKYTEISRSGYKHAALASTLGSLTWKKPLYSEFQQLARESEYAAWTLVNGYALNHVTISTHQLKSNLKHIKCLNQLIEENGFKLNSEGGVLKVSPDGLLQQSSTVADSVTFEFSDGVTESVPCSYIEFAERLVLPQFKNLPEEQIKEIHRRDGFEVGNADKIFESTSKEQLTRKAP